jgi:hypothetical protein
MALSSQLLNTALNPARLGGESVERARLLVQGAAKQAAAGTRIQYLESKAAQNPQLAQLAAVLSQR